MLSRYDLTTEQQKRNAIFEVNQQVILAGLYAGGFFESAAFYGGTCLRIFHGLQRFSEDMDFSLLTQDDKFDFTKYFPAIVDAFTMVGREVEIKKKDKRNFGKVESAFLKDNTDVYDVTFQTGKRKYARKFSYYCGQTIRCVYRRLKDRDHHFKEIEHSDYSIWIGKFSNVVPNKTDINVVEKIITSELAELELGFENMMNEINFHPPVFDVYIINQWYHPIKNSEWKRIHYNSPANYIPDLMIYDSNSKEMKGTRKIRKLGILE